MTSEQIQKYAKRSTKSLEREAQKLFNAWIRQRDQYQWNEELIVFQCLICRRIKTSRGSNYHCCHFYSVGEYPHLRFHEDNAHGGCLRCNHYSGDQLIRYRENLILKIGQERFDRLEFLAKTGKVKGDQRLRYIEVIEKYSGTRNL